MTSTLRYLLSAICLIIVGAFAWRLASHLSPDSVAMAVGYLFGVLSGIPVALLNNAVRRPRYGDDE